jgi:hypothetical protein
MNANIKETFTRYIATPVVMAGLLGAAALSLSSLGNLNLGAAAVAHAATSTTQPTGPGYSYAPSVKAHPAPEAQPGARWHRGMHHLTNLQPTV